MTCRKFWYYWHTRNDSDSRNGWNASHSGHSGSLDLDRLLPLNSYIVTYILHSLSTQLQFHTITISFQCTVDNSSVGC